MDAGEPVEPVGWWAYLGGGLLWWASLEVLAWGGIETVQARLGASAVFFALFGAACWYNGRRCGAIHCRVSGPGYGLVALAAVLGALELLEVSLVALMWTFLAVMVGSFAIEHWAQQGGEAPGSSPEPD